MTLELLLHLNQVLILVSLRTEREMGVCPLLRSVRQDYSLSEDGTHSFHQAS